MKALRRGCLLLALLSILAPARAVAEDVDLSVPEPTTQVEPKPKWKDIRGFGWFAFGAVTGFVLHEAGHVFANLFQGNVPSFRGISGFGFVPFFAVTPNLTCHEHACYKRDGSVFRTGHRGRYMILTGGFTVQHLTDEILLTRRPELRYEKAPFRKGLLAFNVLLSVGYAIASVTRIENPEGDLSSSAEAVGMPREAYAALLLIPAAMDTYRYFVPNTRWAPVVSRIGKVTLLGLVFAI